MKKTPPDRSRNELGKRAKKRSSRLTRIETRPQRAPQARVFLDSVAEVLESPGPLRWWAPLYSYLFLAAATIFCLAPFSGRAFHIDDTLFVGAARQIAQHPSDPYGFQVIWDTTWVPMSDVTENPPLASYYIALIARVLGWSERALHLGFIPVAIALILGTYRLAQKFTRSPLLASLCTLLTPGVLVSASSVMCDTMMLAIWIWAAYFWIEGLDSRKTWMLVISGMLTAASAMTKYFGASLVILLLVYSIARFRRLKSHLLVLLIPLVTLFAYELWTADLYGHGLLQGAAEFAQKQQNLSGSLVAMAMVGLSYTGGCSLLGLSFAPLVWSRRQLAIAAVVSAIAALGIATRWLSIGLQVGEGAERSLHWFVVGELALCIAAGILVLGLTVYDFWVARNADSLFLGLWVLGTFYFAAFVNWSVNARSVLPLIPGAAILLARRFDDPRVAARNRFVVGAILLASCVFSLWITAADSELANSARTGATFIQEKTRDKGGALWFVGHWGFQYYMQTFGATPLDPADPQARSGDFVALPKNNTHLAHILPAFIASQESISLPVKSRATTMSSELGAGFYSSRWGPLPYVVGPVPPERYLIIRLANIPVRKP